jgi:glycosyltransferase involved in cell wall biosynthesis
MAPTPLKAPPRSSALSADQADDPSAKPRDLRDPASAPEAERGRLLVVSHPAVVDVNQEVYRELARRGWDVTIVLPSSWRHEYSEQAITPQPLAGMEASLRPTRVALSGRPQRHVYLTSCRRVCKQVHPDVAFLEAEPFALPAAQWGFALSRLDIPFGVQCYENIDRDLPAPIRWMRTAILRKAAFVGARSATAGALAREWGAKGEVALAPPAVPGWNAVPAREQRPFTVGYAGRLVESKGLMDLLAAVRQLDAPVELVLIGDGDMRAQLDGQPIPGSKLRVLSDLTHAQMASGYARFDVLALPSHTTATWKEQFGRVIIEALWCGVPVVGSDSGEIPWLIERTHGGVVFPERDVDALARQLAALRADPELRRRLADAGREAVERLFSVAAATTSLETLLQHALAPAGRIR